MSHIPPLDERLQFAKNAETGRVHIMRWFPRDEPAPFAQITFSTLVQVLCGKNQWDSLYVAGDGFTDDALCIGCIRALGDQSWRAFHADNRGY